MSLKLEKTVCMTGEFCLIHHQQESAVVGQVLHSSVEEARQHIKKLTDDELIYCLRNEGRRITIGRMLEVEARKRKRARTA